MNKEKKPKSEEGKKRPKIKIDKKKAIRIAIIVSVILLIMTLLFVYTNNENFRSWVDTHIFRREVHEGTLPYINIGRNTHIYAYNGSIITLEQNTLRSFNRVANEEFSLGVRILSPIFESSGRYLVVAEAGGSRVYLISGRNIIWQKELEGEIDSVAVNRNGYVAVALADPSYRKIIETFNRSGTELFRKFIATSTLVDMDISNDNRYLAIAELDLSGIIMQSSIRIISIESARADGIGAEVFAHTASPGDIIISINYSNRNHLICRYGSHVESIRNNSTREQLVSFSGGGVLFVDSNLNTHIAKVEREDTETFSSDTILRLIDNNDPNRGNSVTIARNTKKHIYIWKYDGDKSWDGSFVFKY
ncbi:MAG: DUF5711 family protein [Oscillospiraceae bacterium]|nr:DUF5711 family protein [Oscillospiraceae bacterium]